MSSLPDFQANPEWIQSRLKTKVPLEEIKKAMDFLIQNHYLELSPSGDVSKQNKELQCISGIFKVALSQFHREMLTLAIDSIEKTPHELREIMGHTFSISQNQFNEVRDILLDALKKITSLKTDKTGANSIYHIGFAAFPLTKKEE